MVLVIILLFLLALVFLTLGENTAKPTPTNVAHLELVVLPGQNPTGNPSEGNPPAGGDG
jgi:hypothetical protein